MNHNDDLIELYHGAIGDIEINSARICHYGRTRSTSLYPRSRSCSIQRQNSGSFSPLNEDDSNDGGSVRFDHHTAEIIRSMEENDTLMEDNPISEHLRLEYLRDLPQNLTMKRSVKARVTRSVTKKSKHRPLGFWKITKYHFSITFNKFRTTTKNLIYSLELWYSSLKTIEGHFGSGVATYFKFLRWIFIMNFLISIPAILFLFIPQIIYDTTARNSFSSTTELTDENNQTVILDRLQKNISKVSLPFSIADIITGEGYLTQTPLFHGHYTNNSILVVPGTIYSVPYAYFFTMLFSYVTAFIVLSISMARSYRRSFIETSGGLKNVYAHKVFCGWDYSVATKEGADLKYAAIYNELKELLSDENKVSRKMSNIFKFWTRATQLAIHLFILLLLAGTGYLMWILLKKHRNFTNTGSESSDLGSASVITALVVTIIMNIGPLLFSFIVKFEDYKKPRTAIYISLVRTFLLEIVVIGVLVFFWLHNEPTAEQCWETYLGQEVYRLIFVDFIVSVVLTALFEFLRLLIYKYLWEKIGISEFDIATNTLQIIYNQTLFWVGFYFSPLLCLVVTLKFWCTWYLKRLSCLHCCKASTKSWRAAQTQTIFQVMTFLALFAVVIVYGYIFTRKKTSYHFCGPFQDYEYVYEMMLKGVLQIQEDHGFMKFVVYLTKPGVIMGLLIIMSLRVYYVRAKSMAQRSVVEILREMLVLEAKDKEFLLTNISKISEGNWIYNMEKDRNNRVHRRNHQTYPSNTWNFYKEKRPNIDANNSPSENNLNSTKSQQSSTMENNEEQSPPPSVTETNRINRVSINDDREQKIPTPFVRRLPRYDFHDMRLISDGHNPNINHVNEETCNHRNSPSSNHY